MRDQVVDAGDYVANFLNSLVEGLPELLAALAILLIGYIIAKVVAGAIHNLLGRAQLNQRMHSARGGNFIQRAVPNPTELVSRIAFWVIFLLAVSIAVSALGIPILADFVRAVYSYIPNIIAALLIFLVAGGIAGAVVTLVTSVMGETPTGKIVATVAPIIVMSVATFMILNQLKIAPEIVNTLFAVITGSAGLGLALAFGLGGREVAARMLGDLYTKGQEQQAQVRQDFKHGANRAKDQANEVKRRAS